MFHNNTMIWMTSRYIQSKKNIHRTKQRYLYLAAWPPRSDGGDMSLLVSQLQVVCGKVRLLVILTIYQLFIFWRRFCHPNNSQIIHAHNFFSFCLFNTRYWVENSVYWSSGAADSLKGSISGSGRENYLWKDSTRDLEEKVIFGRIHLRIWKRKLSLKGSSSGCGRESYLLSDPSQDLGQKVILEEIHLMIQEWKLSWKGSGKESYLHGLGGGGSFFRMFCVWNKS